MEREQIMGQPESGDISGVSDVETEDFNIDCNLGERAVLIGASSVILKGACWRKDT